jgi:hypothetical protein
MGKKLTNEEFQERLSLFREQGHDVYCDDEYVDSKTRLWFYCSKGHRWYSEPNWVFNGQFCPYCLNRRVLVGYNDLWTTHSEIASLLQNPQDGYEHTYGSKYKTYFICQCCGNIIFKSIKEVYSRGLGCQRCGDTISYPNKFMRALLSQLDVQNIKHEYSPSWLYPYSYDNYFEINGYKILLEADGGIGHGNKVFGSNEVDTDGLERDRIKDKLAQEHEMHVVRIDCNYKDYNKYKYIKQNILSSRFANIVDLSCVDWDKCHAEALSSLVYKCAEMYNKGFCVGDIVRQLGYDNGTVSSWLKQAAQIGLCTYNKEESRKRGRKLLHRAVNQYSKDGFFIGTYESLTTASLATSINSTAISNCCKKKKYFHTAGGFCWFYVDDPGQPDKTQIISTTQN